MLFLLRKILIFLDFFSKDLPSIDYANVAVKNTIELLASVLNDCKVEKDVYDIVGQVDRSILYFSIGDEIPLSIIKLLNEMLKSGVQCIKNLLK